MAKLIIFDLQGTLVENGVFPSPTKQVRYILRVRQDFHEYVTGFEKVFMTKQYDNLSQAFMAVADFFKVHTPDFIIEKLVGIWNKNKLLSKMFPETEQVLKDMKDDYKLVLMANIDCFSKDIVEKFKLNEYFDATFLSCDTGMLKTDNGFYDKILERFDMKVEDAIVVGDSLESDMKSAENAGIKSVLVDRNGRMEYERKISNLSDLKSFL